MSEADGGAGGGGAAAAPVVAASAGAIARGVRPIPPVFLEGEVVHGFGRGSRVLGIPTANLPDEVVKTKASHVKPGVYFGWAVVIGDGDSKTASDVATEEVDALTDEVPAAPTVHKAVLSVGWNPHFKGTKKTVEPHLLHDFGGDFYGAQLRLLICGHLRDEAAFDSLEALMSAIHEDIRVAREALDSEEFAAMQSDARLVGEAAANDEE
mmetsp:Transcript_19252/g.67993  ORF Transcript_19252/g.67993 Transcript_19252/m.67993 type:complete len:210 (-) Transcript_19252:143-772(-)